MTQTFVVFLLLLISCYFLSFRIMHALGRVSGKYLILRLILFPGVIVHELSHAVACLLTGTPIESMSFWTETGGNVVHHKPKLAVFTQPIISFAPFPVGIASLLFLSNYITGVHWIATFLSIFLMVSIAGTLAPSKTDFVGAIEGTLVLLAIFTATAIYLPDFLAGFTPAITNFNQKLLLVDGILLAIWLVLSLFHRAIMHIAR
jgi:hypothetical protein